MPTLRELQGLNKNTRNSTDTRAISEQSNPTGTNNYNPKDFEVKRTTYTSSPSDKWKVLAEPSEKAAMNEYNYQVGLSKYLDKYNVGTGSTNVPVTESIKNVASKTSPYYKKFGNTSYISLKDDDWARLAASYNAMRETYGEDYANKALNSEIKNNVAKNQPWTEQAWYGFTGMGASAAGSAITTAGAVKGAIDYMTGNYQSKDYLNGWDNFMNSVIDNNWTRYGNDVVKYGNLGIGDALKSLGFNTRSGLQEAKNLGLSDLEIVEDRDQENSMINATTPWQALQSGGFTVASMFTGWGLAKAAGYAFNGIKGLATLGKTGEALMATRNVLSNIQKAENVFNKFAIPGMVGTTEGLVEGLNTKTTIEENGLNILNQTQQNKVDEEMSKKLQNYRYVKDDQGNLHYYDKNNRPVNIQALYKETMDAHQDEYNEGLKQIDYASSKGGINNFYINSIINGLTNSTLKAGLQAPTVKKALQNSKILGWAQPKGNFNISGTGADINVTPKFGIAKSIFNIAKEPIGEFAEEYLQSVSDATVRGGAENNIHDFVNNKYLGDGSAAVGQDFSDDLGAAWSAFTGSLTDKETIKSGVYGAISSALGVPTLGRRARTGRVNSNGEVESTTFGRGLNAEGERESNFERIQRLTPWRSGLLSEFNKTRTEKKEAVENAEALQSWLTNPDNKSKYDGLVGTYNWAKSMGSAAGTNDEFGYRNSTLGKTISDAFMLDKTKGTQYYDSYMNQLSEVANLEEGSDNANKYIQSMRDNNFTNDDSASDSEILKTLKKNANQMLNTLNSIQQESDNIDKLLGNVDEDTKQSLIYGQLMLNDWNQRSNELKSELGNIKIDDTVEHSSNINNKQKEVLAKYQSYDNAQRAMYKLEETKSALNEDINNISSRSNVDKQESNLLKEKKAKVKTIDKELESIKSLTGVDESNTTLSESEIMALDPVSRALMLQKGSKKLYDVTQGTGDNQTTETRNYFSPEQQSVIDNLIARGTSQDREFLNKVVDAGRIENSTKSFLTQYNSILTDKDSFNDFVYRAKEEAKTIATKNRYQALEGIQNYSDFATEMDKMLNNSSEKEQRTINKALSTSNNPNFIKYKKDRETLAGLYNQVVNDDKFQTLDSNEVNMFHHTLTYLMDNNINLSDENAVVEALATPNEDGSSKFEDYVNQANNNLPENERTQFTGIGEAIQTFKDVMKSYEDDNKEKESNSKPIVPTPTVSNQASPSPIIEPKPSGDSGTSNSNPTSTTPSFPSIFDMGTSENIGDKEGVNADIESNGKQTSKEPEVNNIEKDIIDTYKANSNDAVANSAQLGIKSINNSPEVYSNTSKQNAINTLGELSDNEFDTPEEFSEAIVQKANKLETNSDSEEDSNTASLLRQAASKILNQSKETKRKALIDSKKTNQTSVFNRGREQANSTNNKIGNDNQLNNDDTKRANSSIIQSSNIEFLEDKYPDSPVVKYWQDNHIKEFLRSDEFNDNRSKKIVMFITDENLSNSIKDNMESKGATFTKLDTPIIAVVESPNGNISVNGKNYQPIGTFPSTNTKGFSGTNNVGRIRDLINNQPAGQFIKDNKGNVLISGVTRVVAHAPSRIEKGSLNRNAQDLSIQTLNQRGQDELNNLSKKERRESILYKSLKQKFLNRIGYNNSNNMLFENVPDLAGENKDFNIMITPISNTIDRNSNASITQLFNEDNVDGLLQSNSRLSKTAKVFEEIASQFPDTRNAESILLDTDESGNLIPVDATVNLLNSIAENLTKKVNKNLSFPNRNWKFELNPTVNTLEDGRRLFQLNLIDGNGNSISIGTITNGNMSTNTQFELLKNLIMDGESVRKNGNYDFIKWQVDHPKGTQTVKDIMGNLANAYDDGILELSNNGIEYMPQGIEVRSPFTASGEVVNSNLVGNKNNAQPATPLNTPTLATTDQVVSGNAIIDSSDGSVLEGKQDAPINRKLEAAKSIVQQIVTDTQNIQLSDDGKDYINSITGTKYARVTSIISADEESNGRFDPNSPWILPSTNIGTGIDNFVRDFFAGETDNKTYPNVTESQLNEFKTQLQGLKNSLEARGLTVIPKDITVTGSIEVTEKDGTKHNIDVAGTLDLLAYDNNGYFYIFDMKTHHSQNIDDNKKAKFTRQLSLYQNLIEAKYGIKVKNLNIIPIKVSYPDPKGYRNATAEYSVDTNNQLSINSNEFHNANPNLGEIIPITYRDSNILYDKLSDDEKSQIKALEDIIKEGNAVVNQTTTNNPVINNKPNISIDSVEVAKPTSPVIDPIIGLAMSDDLGLWNDDLFSNPLGSNTSVTPRVVSDRLAWNNWDNFTNDSGDFIDVPTTLDILSKIYTEEQWNQLSDEEMEHELKCKGFFNI